MFFPFLQVLIPTVVFFHESNYWKSIARFSNSCKKYCLHNCTLWGITITVDPRTKFGLRKGDCFVKKMSFSRVFFSRWPWIFFLTNRTNFVYWSSSPRIAKTCCWKLLKYLKWHFSRSDPSKVWPAFSQIFPVTLIFFKILTTGTKGSIIPKFKRNPGARD